MSDPTPEACSRCGLLAVEFAEGVCVPCRDANQQQLDEANASYDHWHRLTPEQREAAIRNAR